VKLLKGESQEQQQAPITTTQRDQEEPVTLSFTWRYNVGSFTVKTFETQFGV
jgi:hypothetical protein